MALILALARHSYRRRATTRRRKVWRGMISDISRTREDELGGKTLLIVGLGKIGARLAQLAKAFDLKVVATRRDPRARARALRMPSTPTTACPSCWPRPTSSRSPAR